MSQPTERQCAQCGHTYRGRSRNAICSGCAAHDCPSCGTFFRGYDRECPKCRGTERTCVTCGESFRGRYRKCLRCRRTERICPDCGGTYAGDQYKCRRCRMIPRACERCGNTFRGDMRICATCYATDRVCPGCGRTFHSVSTECLSCSGRANVMNGRRRARKAAAEVAGPVPRAVYLAVRKSGPCVYCGAPAATVDHIRPLSRHGHEAPYNLVPACRRCNYGKRNRLLTEWDPVRVAHAAAHSSLVAAELKRLADDAIKARDSVTGKKS